MLFETKLKYFNCKHLTCYFRSAILKRYQMASEMSDDASEPGAEIPTSSASSVSNYDIHNTSEALTVSVTSGTDDSNSCTLEPSSSETDSYMSSGVKGKDDASGSGEPKLAPKEDSEDNKEERDKLPMRPGIIWRKGERLEAMDYLQKWYPAKVIEIDEAELCVRIHFEGWNQRYDEWVDMNSDHLRPLTRHSERWNRQRRRKQKSEYKVGDKVLAKWTDCKMYLAKIDEVYSDGSYGVLFYDGFKKTIQAINLSPAPTEQKQSKFLIKPPLLSRRDLKKLKSKPLDYKVTGSKEAKMSGKGRRLKRTEKLSPGSSSTVSSGQPGDKLQRAYCGPHKKNKLIVAGSLFAKRNKSDGSSSMFKKNKEVGKGFTRALNEQLKVKQELTTETPEEELPEKEDKPAATPGAEASSQTEVYNAEKPSLSPAKKEKRAGSFPPTRRRKRKHLKVPGPLQVSEPHKVSASVPVLKKAQSTDVEEKPIEEKVPLSAPPLMTLPSMPPKAFVVEEDHNSHKCVVPGCGKSFRKASLLESHVKYYHSEEAPQSPTIPRRRKKTPSMCSTDSETSMSSRSNTTRRKRHFSEVSTVASLGSPDLAMKISFDEEEATGASHRMELTVLEEAPAAEMEEESPEEVVNCKCGLNEENGFMIQCDVCMCWQHTQCFNIDDGDLDSITSYVCQICKQTPGVRDSARHLYDMDWFRHGRLPSFSYLQQDPSPLRQKEVMATHDLVADVIKVQRMVHGLRQQIAVTREKDHPELRLWKPALPKETRSLGVSTSDSSLNSKATVRFGAHSQAGSAGQEGGIFPVTDGVSFKDQPALTGDRQTVLPPTIENGQAAPLGKDAPSNGETPVKVPGIDLNVVHSMEVCDEDTNVVKDEEQVDTIKLEPGLKSESAVTSGPAAFKPPEQGDLSDGLQGEKSDTVFLPTPACGAESSSKTVDDQQVRAQGTITGQSEDKASSTVKTEAVHGVKEEKREAAPAALIVRKDPFADCKLSVLLQVRSAQDDLAAQLDGIEVQIAAMERREFGEEAAGSYGNIPALKHALHRIARDLDKVKGIAVYR